MDDTRYETYENFVPDPETQEFMNEEIKRAPRAPGELRDRLESSSMTPEVSGGDIDAEWEEANDDGAEAFAGHNPTPDQSNVEENAAAMGFNFEDNQEIDLVDKMQRRDRDRFELDENSKATDDMI